MLSPERYVRGNMSTKETLWRRHRCKSQNTEGYISRKVSSPERIDRVQACGDGYARFSNAKSSYSIAILQLIT